MIHLDYRDARPIYSQIIDGFRQQIAAGVLQPGDKMPSVRELAAELTINPNTIQRAYRELEHDGWIATVPGKGCYVNAVAEKAAPQQDLLQEFDAVAERLRQLGITPEMLAQRLKGGK